MSEFTLGQNGICSRKLCLHPKPACASAQERLDSSLSTVNSKTISRCTEHLRVIGVGGRQGMENWFKQVKELCELPQTGEKIQTDLRNKGVGQGFQLQ